jgi:23S rRNA pseudouridine1911/1915/1917 synthase
MGYHILVPDERSGIELDEFLSLTFPLLNKGFLRQKVRDGRVLVDGSPAKPSQRLKQAQVLSIEFEEDEDYPDAPEAPRIELPVLYEDAEVLVVDKPAGIAVEPERWERGNACVAGALLELALGRSGLDPALPDEPMTGLDFRPRLVHRIDKDTSGALLVAKNLESERRLREAFEERRIDKIYLALVEGEHPLAADETEIIDLPIAPDLRRSGKMRVHESGKEAQTRVRVAQRYAGYTLMACEPLSGRTHQIRVHLSASGFPLVVDPLYGRQDAFNLSTFKRGYRPKRGQVEKPLIERLTLHAASIGFPDQEGRQVSVDAPLAKDLDRTLKQLGKWRPARR